MLGMRRVVSDSVSVGGAVRKGVRGFVSGDILADERVLRSRRRWWSPASWLSGRAGLVVLVAFLLLGPLYLYFNDRISWLRADRSSVSTYIPQSNEAGRDLTPSEFAMARFFGEPIRLGDGGFPVVRLDTTGEVRELTPVEVEFEESARFASTGENNVVWGPGPRGWGIWWKDQTEVNLLASGSYFTRYRWFEKQKDELSLAVSEVSRGLHLVEAMDFSLWSSEVSGPLYVLTNDLKMRYRPVAFGHWGVVPMQWQCNESFEEELNQGMTQGCPGLEYLSALGDAWVSVGKVVERMQGMSRLGVFMDRMGSRDLHQSDVIMDQVYHASDLLEDVSELERALADLERVSSRREMTIAVRLFE